VNPSEQGAIPLLAVDKLNVSFGESRVVRDVSFSIAEGEKFALVGESGSGKSVTALSILRLVDGARYSGAIRFSGNDLLKEKERVLRGIRGRDIAMIFQEPMTALDPLFTVGAQIEEVLSLHEGLGGPAARKRSIELLAKTGVPNPDRRVDSYPHQLSGGQRQRAMIAMALACRPKLLIADEPTTALDVTIQAQILQLLDQLQAEFGMAILFITHDLNLVRRFTHRVGVMEKGDLVEIGETAQVFSDPQHPYTKKLIASRPERRVHPLPEGAPVILQGQNLRVSFSSSAGWFKKSILRAVDDVTLNVKRGETLGIVGESGSGKSTLAMALLGLQTRVGGNILLDGVEINHGDRRGLLSMRRRMQVVFQDPFGSLNPRMTVSQILTEGLSLHHPGLTAAEKADRVARTLDEVGLGEASGLIDVAGRYPHEFSGGQRQRIAIARVIIIEPELVVLDEPTSALDVSVQQQILRLLGDLQVNHHMSYVFISHDLAVVRAMSHRVAVMKDGKVVEEGEAEALFANPHHDYTKTLLAAEQLG
jgi:microcin C transport system ATP-binding protein